MKKMKRIAALIAAGAAALMLTACSGGGSKKAVDPAKTADELNSNVITSDQLTETAANMLSSIYFFEEGQVTASKAYMSNASTADEICVVTCKDEAAAKAAVDELRKEGWKVGVLKLRVFRPFPEKELAQALSKCRAAAIMDRCESYNGCSGPLGSEVPAALYRAKVMIETVNYIYGLAGRDFTVEDVKDIFAADDLTIANLECTFTEATEKREGRYFWFKAPASYCPLSNGAGRFI